MSDSQHPNKGQTELPTSVGRWKVAVASRLSDETRLYPRKALSPAQRELEEEIILRIARDLKVRKPSLYGDVWLCFDTQPSEVELRALRGKLRRIVLGFLKSDEKFASFKISSESSLLIYRLMPEGADARIGLPQSVEFISDVDTEHQGGRKQAPEQGQLSDPIADKSPGKLNKKANQYENWRPKPGHETLPTMDKRAESLPQMIEEQNKLLREQNELLKIALGLTPAKLQQILGQISHPIAEESLTEDQEAFFQKLEAIQGGDAGARKRVAKELAALEGQPVSKALVKRLQAFLKSREWGIETDNAIAAAPIWQPDRGSPRGGYLRLSYTDPVLKRGVQTKSFSYFPAVIIVPRPDARRHRDA